jgi:hypothetical protein
MCTWTREAEITADRGGLVCCQDPQVAYNALGRLLSGLDAKSTWIDPNRPDFDAGAIVRDFKRWQDQPFVKFVLYVKKSSRESPYIPERIAALKLWSESAHYQEILRRTSDRPDPNGDQLVVIKTIKAAELADKGDAVHPYVRVFNGSAELFHTPYVKNASAATWSDIDFSCQCSDRQPLYFEVWSKGYVRDTFVGGFIIYPVNPKSDPKEGRTDYLTSIDWSWKSRSDTLRKGLAEVSVEFDQKAK